MEEENKNKEQVLPIMEIPTIKKIVDCPRCKAKIEVEFEIELDALIPATIADVLSATGQPKEENDKD